MKCRVALAMGVMLLGIAFAGAADRPPNFVVMMADDFGAHEVACYGNPVHRTPNLDTLAQNGVRFETCWAMPLCSPTRMALMTGRYAFRTGWYNLIGRPYAPERGTPEFNIGEHEITFADILKAKGYKTGLVGKWQLPGKFPESMIYDCGFDEYFAWLPNEHLTLGAFDLKDLETLQLDAVNKGSRFWNPVVYRDGKRVATTEDDYGPDLFAEYAIDFFTRHRDEPFFLYYPMALTHTPWDPTPDPNAPGQKTKGGIQANTEYLDHIVGRIVSALDRLGLRENTILFFTGDNGTKQYGDMTSGKGSMTELGAHVPLIVAGAGVRRGVVSDALVDLTDVFPTLAELSGAEMPSDRPIDGRSFAFALTGQPGQERDWIFACLQDKRMMRDRRWLLQGDGQFFDCGDSRDGTGYKNVTESSDPEVVAARARFEEILKDLPAPATQPKEAKGKGQRAKGNAKAAEAEE